MSRGEAGTKQRTKQRYEDPVDAVWLGAARNLGIHVERSNQLYARYDGRGTLYIAEPAQLDPDDSLGRLLFHELCHALVMGEQAAEPPNEPLREHACQRLQAALCDRHGLREVLVVTAEQRSYWDALPDDPLAAGDDPAIELARAAWVRSRKTPWRDVLHDALSATAVIARAAQPFAGADSAWPLVRAPHPTGMALHRNASLTCGDCAWLVASVGSTDTGSGRCRQTRHAAGDRGKRVERTQQACERHEPRLDEAACGRCGACCRQGFDLVQVRPRDRILRLHPELVSADRHGLHVPRPSGLCVALVGDGAPRTPYRCRVYQDRPRACADFELAGDAGLLARRRVGLSR